MKITTASAGFGLLLAWMAVTPARASPIAALLINANDRVTVDFNGTMARETYWLNGIPGDGAQFTEFDILDSAPGPINITIQAPQGAWSSGPGNNASPAGQQLVRFMFESDPSGFVSAPSGATQIVKTDTDADDLTGSLVPDDVKSGPTGESVPESASWTILGMGLLLGVARQLRKPTP